MKAKILNVGSYGVRIETRVLESSGSHYHIPYKDIIRLDNSTLTVSLADYGLADETMELEQSEQLEQLRGIYESNTKEH